MLAIILAVMLLLFSLNIPVAFVLLIISGSLTVYFGLDVMTLAQRVIGGMNSFILLTVPFFLMVGAVMNKGGITERIFRFATALVGHIPGGLGHVNVLASIIFAGMSGAAQADAAGLGQIEIEGMINAGFDKGFSAAITAASSTIGPIIPPSIGLVIYGALGGVSIGSLLLAGIVPGLVMGIFLMIAVYVISCRRKYPVHPRATLRELVASFREAFWALLAPVILLGGIFSGSFTPSEAGAIAALYSIIVSAFVYKELTLADIPSILQEIIVANAGIMLLIGAAAPLGWLLSWQGIPQAFAQSLLAISADKWILLLLINLFLLVAGMFMEGTALMTILVPLLLPVVTALGVDPVHFGVIVVLNLQIGGVTPPFGVLSYIVCIISKLTLWELMKDMWPFLIALLLALLVVTFSPGMVLFLPRLALG